MCLVGIEGTGSYGAGLARHVTAAGIRVVEAVRSDRQDRRRQGKSDPLDAVSAARAAQSGRAPGFMAPASGAGLICPAWTRGRGSQFRRASGGVPSLNLRKGWL